MAKGKAAKGCGNVYNKAMYSRISFLYQAATYLKSIDGARTTQADKANDGSNAQAGNAKQHDIAPKSQGISEQVPGLLSHTFTSHLRSISLKSQIRLSTALKQSVCKQCGTLLIDDSTCALGVENKSKNGKKPWAEVLVQRCKACGGERRFPIATERQPRRIHRTPDAKLPSKS